LIGRKFSQKHLNSPSPLLLVKSILSADESMSYGGYGSLQNSNENRPHMKPPPAWSNAGNPPWSTSMRPLSDIRELTEPSLLESTHRKPSSEHGITNVISRKISLRRKDSVQSNRSQCMALSEKHIREEDRMRSSPLRSPESQADHSSIYSVPSGSIPIRSSSYRHGQQSIHRKGSSTGSQPPGMVILSRGRSYSPIKTITARYEPITSDLVRRVPSRTFIRTSQSNDLLEFPIHRHPRVSAELQVSASLFVGGGSIEGYVRVLVDDAERSRHRRALAIARISVDLIGAEETFSPNRRFVFLNLAQELLDSQNPPPHQMVESLKQISPLDPFWLLAPSVSVLPFVVSLPLDVGPPPFNSKYARIRYVLCVTLLIRDAGRQYLVRSSQEVSVLSVYDRKQEENA